MSDNTESRERNYAARVLATLGNTAPTERHLLLCMALLPVPSDWKIGDDL